MLVSVRFQADGRRLEYARGYSRQGAVWSDVQLFTRERLLQLVKSGARIVTGQVAALEGDFVLTGRVKLVVDRVSGALLAVDGVRSDQDNLGLPLF